MSDGTSANDVPTRRRARLPSGSTGRLLASIGNLSNSLGAIHSRYAQHHGLGPRGIWTLSAISEGHSSPGEIARLMLLPASVVSGDLARLLERRLIERERDGRDGRRLRYTLTAEGQVMLSNAHGVYVALLDGKMSSYPGGEVERLLRLLYEIGLHVRAHVEAGSDPAQEG